MIGIIFKLNIQLILLFDYESVINIVNLLVKNELSSLPITMLTSSSFKIESSEPIEDDLSERLNGSKDKLHRLYLVLLCPLRRFGGKGGGELF